MKSRAGTALVLWAALALCGCGPHRFFFHPNKVLYYDPAALKVPHEVRTFPSLNGKILYALWLPAKSAPKGTIVHLHGNFANFSNHFPLTLFLTRAGFDVLVLDYQGFGGSEGKPSPKHVVEDGIAAVRYAQRHLRTPGTGVGVLGQSLGAAAAVVVAAKEPLVRGVVVEAAFSSYPTMARAFIARIKWLWPLYPFHPLLMSRRYSPDRHVNDISPRPVLFIHGTADRTIPSWMSERLYRKAKQPKELWLIEDAGHLGCKDKAGADYQRRVSEFFENAIPSPTKQSSAD